MERGELFTVVVVALLICLSVTLCVLVITGNDAATDKWSFSTNSTSSELRNIYLGEDGTAYLQDGADLKAIDRNGTLKWQTTLPAIEGLPEGDWHLDLQDVVIRDGYLYAYIRSDCWTMDGQAGELITISPDGKLLWHRQIDPSHNPTMTLAGDMIFMIRDTDTMTYSVTAYDLSGNVRWVKDRTFLMPAIGVDGTTYLIKCERIPIYSDVLQAYYPNGSLHWGRSLSAQGVHAPTYLLTHNGTLYIHTVYGLACLGDNGTVRWDKEYYGQTCGEPTFDSGGNVYLQVASDIYVVGPDGQDIACYSPGLIPGPIWIAANEEGILYLASVQNPSPGDRVSALASTRLTAFDLKEKRNLWSYDIKPLSLRTVTLEKNSGYGIIEDYSYISSSSTMNASELSDNFGVPPGTVQMQNSTHLIVLPGNDKVYVSYWATSYEFPIQYNCSRCTYGGGLYVFANDGKLLWTKPTDSYVNHLAEKNGTLYYSTGDGKFSATAVGLTAGLVAATAYVFLRFLLVGAVSRARSRLEQNENRNLITKFIAGNPGATLYDICRGLGMNIGTVRYHLMVLTLNHRVKADKADARYARYFSCGCQYTAEEKLVISFLKRGQVERLVKTLVEKPGLPNAEISLLIGLPESAVSRYLRELAEHGIVVKRRCDNGKLSYAVDEKYLHIIRSQLQV